MKILIVNRQIRNILDFFVYICLETFQNFRKFSDFSGNFSNSLDAFMSVCWVFSTFLAFPEHIKAIRIVSRQTENILDSLESFQTSNFQDYLKIS